VVEREPYNAVCQQLDPRTGEKPGRCRGNYVKFTDHMTRLRAAAPHATGARGVRPPRRQAGSGGPSLPMGA